MGAPSAVVGIPQPPRSCVSLSGGEGGCSPERKSGWCEVARGLAPCEGPRGSSMAVGAISRPDEVPGYPCLTGISGACPLCERELR